MSQIPDNLPNPDFLPPLQKRTRSAAVTAQLTELSRLSRGAVLRRAMETAPERWVEREALVALTRGFLRAGDKASADTVLEILFRRVSKGISGKISGWAGLTPEDRIDASRQMLVQIYEQVCELGPSAEFWECNFTWCLQKRLVTLWRRLTERTPSIASSVILHSDGEEWDRFEQIADPVNGFSEIEVQGVVESLTGGGKRAEAIFLRMSRYPEDEIALRLGVTSRTLRNWLADARAAWHRQADSPK